MARELEWWEDSTLDGEEYHTPRVWEQIAQAARAAGDLRRAEEAEEAAALASA